MALSRVREKYPELKALSDDQLAEQLYQTHYASKMSKSDYYKKLGMPEPTGGTKGLAGIGEDISDSLQNLPSAAMNMIKALPGEAKGAGKQIVTDPKRALLNLLTGASEGVEGLVNTPSNIAKYLKSKDIGTGGIEDAITKARIVPSGVRDLLGKPQEGDALIGGIASFLPYAKIGSAAEGLEAVAKRGGAAAAYGVGQNQDPLQTAIMGMLTETGLKGAGNVGNLIPSKGLRGNLPVEQLENNLRATEGTETGLGDVLGNPKMKQFVENQAASFPYSGADQAMQRTAQEIQKRSNNLVGDLTSGQPPENVGETLVGGLKAASKEATDIKNQKWDLVNDLADDNGVTTTRSGLRDTAKKALDKIKSDPDLAAFRSGEDKTLLSTLAEAPKDGKPFSLRDTDFLRGELGERAYQAYLDNDKPKFKQYKDLQKALESDIKDAVDKSGSKELKSARDDAMDYYKNEYSDFEDPDIMRFTRKNADPDTLVQYFLRTGRLTDRANLLKKVQDKLPQESKGLLPYSYFSNAMKEGNIDPNKLRTLYNALGEKQKNVLFPDKERRRAFEDHINLVGKNQEALSLMANPKTGFRIGGALQNALQLGGGAIGGATGHIPGAIAGAAAGHFIPGMAYRPIVKMLTNPKFRDALVKKMIAKEPKRNLAREKMIQDIIERGAKGGRAITLPLANMNENQEQGAGNGY